MVVIYVARGLEWVLGQDWRDANSNTMRHFEMVAEWPPVKSVVPSFKMVSKEGECG